MKPFIRFWLFIICFNVNVTLKARANVIEYPKNCLRLEGENCALRALLSGANVSTESIQIEFSADSILVQKRESYRLVQGTFFVRALSQVKLDIKFGEVYLKTGDMALFRVETGRVSLSTVSGDLAYSLLNKENHMLPAGYTMWMSGPNEIGVGRAGIPAPMDLSRLIVDLSRVTKMSKDEIYYTLKSLKPLWEKAHEETGSRYLASIQETLNREEEQRIRQEQKIKNYELEKKKLRKLFYQKTFLE